MTENNSYDRGTVVERVKAYTEQIQSIEDQIRLIIKSLQQEWDDLSKEEKISKMGLQLQNEADRLHDINLRLITLGIMLDQFRRSKTDSVAENF